MESFEVYYEKFSLNPKNWFQRSVSELDQKARQLAKQKAHEYIPKLKQILKDRGYTIHKHDFSYTVRKDRKLGLEKPNPKEKMVDIPYLKAWFSLAHEVGHILQWNEETDKKHQFEEFWTQRVQQKHEWDKQQLDHLHKLWYELDAWVRGMEFVPIEYKALYKKYAYNSYKTYMSRSPKSYYNEILLRNLLYKLNFQEQI